MNKKIWLIILFLYLFYGYGSAQTAYPAEAENRYCLRIEWHTPSDYSSYDPTHWFSINNEVFTEVSSISNLSMYLACIGRPTQIRIHDSNGHSHTGSWTSENTYYIERGSTSLKVTIAGEPPGTFSWVTFHNDEEAYTCRKGNIEIQMNLNKSRDYGYPGTGMLDINPKLQILNRDNNWIELADLYYWNESLWIERKELSYSDVFQYVDMGQPIKFRIVKKQIDGGISYITARTLYYLPPFEFPAGKNIIVEPPICPNSSPTIKIPANNDKNYTVYINGASGDLSLETNSLSPSDGYYIFTNEIITRLIEEATEKEMEEEFNFKQGNHTVYVENKADPDCPECSGCTSDIFRFTITEIPDFKINSISYPDAAGGFQVPKNGGNGKVSFDISGSKDNNVEIYAGGVSYTPISSSLTASGGYYSGNVVIELPASTYNNAYVTNATGCETDRRNITLTQPDQISFTPTPTPPSCNSNTVGLVHSVSKTNDGKITLSSVSGGIGTLHYSIEKNSMEYKTGDITNFSLTEVDSLPVGDYKITVSDNYGNSKFQNFTITAPPIITVTTNSAVDPSSSCASDGKITVSASGGTGTFKYSNDSTTAFSTTNIVGGYSGGENHAYAQDDCGCVVEIPFELTAPELLKAASITYTPPSCNDYNDGTCTIVFSNLQGALSVTRKPSENIVIDGNKIVISGLNAGDNHIIVEDTGNNPRCPVTVPFTIPEIDAIQTDIVKITPVSDKGSATGSVEIEITGGNAGGYTVSLYDKATSTRQNPRIRYSNVVDACTFSGLAGSFGGKTYYIYVTDSKGCYLPEDEVEVKIYEPEFLLSLEAALTQPVSCYEEENAAVTLTAGGGWEDYRYSADNENWETTNVFDGYGAGTHTFYVKDQYNGTDSATISIVQPQPLTIEQDSIFHVLCNGEATGLLRYRVSGGTYPYILTKNNPLSAGNIAESIVNGDTLFTISNLPAGNYQFTVTDSRNCSAVTGEVIIEEPAKLQLSVLSVTDTSCEEDNGLITAEATGGVPPYFYKLENEGTYIHSQQFTLNDGIVAEFENLPPAQYRITVTDSNGCSVISNILTISDYTNPSIGSDIIRPADCFGENNGSIQVFAIQGTATVSTFALHDENDALLESNATGVFENLYAGNYRIYVYDANGCRSNMPHSAEVKQPDPLVIVVDKISPAAAKGAKEGNISFRVQGGNAGSKTVRLKDADGIQQDSLFVVNGFSASFSVYAGNYTLETEDGKHCVFSTALLEVEEPAESLRFIVTDKNDALCKSQTGNIAVEGIGGWGEYRYKRVSNGQFSTLNRFENLYPGSYQIQVTDKLGAVYSENIVIYEPQDSLRAEITNIQLPTCGNNGSVFIKLSGGTPPYRLYNEQNTVDSNTAQTVEWSGLESGLLQLTLIDNNGCRFELETLLPETSLLKIERFELKYPNTGSNNGSIKAVVTGGVAPFTYQWAKNITDILPNNTALSENIGAGYYTLTVTDAGGCSITETVYLASPDDKPFEIVEIGHETAFEAKNGFAVLYADVALTDFTLITPQRTACELKDTDVTANFRVENDTVYLTNLESGKWFIIGIAADGQQFVAEFIINICPEFEFGHISIIPVAAKGDATGSIKVEIKGGGGGNRFIWTNAANEPLLSVDEEYGSTVNGLAAGIYTVLAEDRYGNQLTKTIEVHEPAEKLAISLVDKKNQDCKDDENAWVIVAASGGWGDYQFRHDSETYFNNGSSFDNLPTRDNYFYLVDKMGVTDSLKVEITEPEYLRAAVAFVDSVKCKDSFDGSILFEITGGTPPYYFKKTDESHWTKGNRAVNLGAGWYTYVFTDSLNCTGQDILNVYVPEPDSLLFSDIRVTHTTCESDNGKIVVSLQGGTRPYRYSWLDYNNVEIGTDSIITDLKQNGVYTLNVVDANGCTQYFRQLINPSTLPRILQIATTEVLCYGDTTGTARITDFAPGVPFAPYTFTWSNGDTGDYSARFEKGMHHVTIEDENGCSTTYYFEITQPEPLILNFIDVTEPQCYGYGNGYIGTETLGGRGAYSYLWSTGATTPYIEHLFKGDYRVEVTDENGCVFRHEITLNEPDYKTMDLGEDISICPGNTVVIDGQDFATHRWFTSAGNISAQRYLSVTQEGYYFLEATDENGCSVWGDIYVSVGNHALTADLLLPSVAAVGDTLVVFELSNMALDSLEWLYDDTVFERIYPDNEYNLPYAAQFLCLQQGMYNIGLRAYANGCYSPVYKQIEVAEEGEKQQDGWGYKEPLIVALTQYPNPTDGQFTVELELRETAEAHFILFEIASGICMEQRTVNDDKNYQLDYDIRGFNKGTYALIVTAGNERRQVKVIVK